MNEANHQPVEPGWNHQPGDPEDIERWWTGADWSEYTRPAPEPSNQTGDGMVAGEVTATDRDVDAVSATDVIEATDVTPSEDVFDLSVAGSSRGSSEEVAVERITEADGSVAFGATSWGSTEVELDQVGSDFESTSGELGTTRSPFDPGQTEEGMASDTATPGFDTPGFGSFGFGSSDSGGRDAGSQEAESPDSANPDTANPEIGDAGFGGGGLGTSGVWSDSASVNQGDSDAAVDSFGAAEPASATGGTAFGGWNPSQPTDSPASATAPPIGLSAETSSQFGTSGQYGSVPPSSTGGQPYQYQQSQPDPGSTSSFGGLGAAGSNAAAGFLARIRGTVDTEETGWDRNLATIVWIPVIGVISVIAYALSGSQMSRHARSHIAGWFNFAVTATIMTLFIASIQAAQATNVAVGVLWWFLLTVGFGAVVFLLSKRDADHLGPIPYWIWYGVWVLVALLTAVTSFGSAFYLSLFGFAQLVLIVINAVRARVGMDVNFLGYPALPILSQR